MSISPEVLLAFLVGIVSGIIPNLMSEGIIRFWDFRSEQRSKKRLARNQSEALYVEQMLKIIEHDRECSQLWQPSALSLRAQWLSAV